MTIIESSTSSPLHAVQFYETDDFLFEAVATFCADGLKAGQPAIVIATDAHWGGFRNALKTKGFDANQVVYADARTTLDAFMDGPMPDEAAFRAQIGGLITRSGNGSGAASVRAYGEMVDLLWRDGNPEAAVRLEELWNDLIREEQFKLLCAYPIGNFYKEMHCRAFDQVCTAHSHVIPQGLGAQASDAQAREIALLRQRAGALQTEVEHRKALEKALRDSLSSRRETEEALRRSERELMDFFDNATVGMHWVGADGTILWANAAELKLLGYSPEEYLGHKIMEFHADRDVVDGILRRLLANEVVRGQEARLVAKDGAIRHVEISSSALFEDGAFKHTRCFTHDITDRKRLEAERRRDEEANAFLLDAAYVLYRSLDYETRLTELARLIVPRLADWCAVDVMSEDGSFARVTVAGETPEQPDDETIRGVLRGGEPLIVNDGAVSMLVVPMRHTSGVLGTISLVAHRPRRRYDPFDRTFALELARRAGVAIENARLYRFAQQANRAKDEFLATLSHELRTPLTAILGWARMLRMGDVDSETYDLALETIERSARSQATLIDDILDLSKVVTGKIALQSELVDLTGAVNNAIDTVRLAANAKKIHVDFVHPSQPAFVTGDAMRLQQVVWNLLANAIKFSKPGTTVQVELKVTSAVARVVVRDEGSGIRRDFLPHVFEPFRQAEASTTRAHGGLGLGLAIVKYFTEMHGGSIVADSAGEGTGATFTVTLPLAPRRPEEGEIREHAPAPADLHGTSILVVDDDDDTRIVVSAALRNAGAEVRGASSVAQACRLLDLKMPDVLIADIAMPQEDGFALIEQVRRRAAAGALPAVAMTALVRAEDEERILGSGFDVCARKPVEPLELAALIAQLRSLP